MNKKETPTGLHPGIRAKMILLIGGGVGAILTITTIVKIFGIPFTMIEGDYQRHRSLKIQEVQVTADIKTGEVQRFFSEWIHDINFFATIANIDPVLKRFKQGQAQGEDQGTLLAETRNLEAYRLLLSQARSFLADYEGDNKVQIIDTKTGVVLLSTHEENNGLNLSAHEGIRNAMQPGMKVQVLLQKEGAAGKVYVNFIYPMAHSSLPEGEQAPLSVLMVSLDTQALLSPILHKGIGHEGSGEIILVDMDRTILFPLKFPLPGNKTAETLSYTLDTKASEVAAWGINGLVFQNDYRGVPVIAVVRHLRLTPEYGIGLIIKCDEREVMAFPRQQLTFSLLISGMGLALLLYLIYFLSDRITRPIVLLSRTAKRIMKGERDERISIQSKDEIGQLAASFNAMIETIEQWQDALESKVRERTELLSASEAQLAEAQRIAHIGSWTQDAAGQLTWSAEMYRIYGVTPETFSLDADSWLSLIHPEDRGKFQKCKSSCLTEKKQWELLLRIIRPDGSLRWINCRGERQEDQATTNSMTMAGTSQDVTESILAQEENDRLQYSLNQAQKMEAIGVLAGGIAHDFNNILSVILGYTEMAQEDAPSGTQFSQDLDKILAASNRAKELVKQILAFSRQAKVERIPIKIQPLLKEGLKMLRASIPSTISIAEDIDPSSGPILADPTQIHQILMNLCTNAYHAMEQTGGALSLSLKTTFITPDNQQSPGQITPGEYVELTVSDTGHGIELGIMEKIFDPFFTTKEVGKGTGMGLSIIHGIIKSCGGALTVESQLGKGTTFHVYLPVIKEEALQEIVESEPLPKGKERILFVDDEEILAKMGRDMLERLGYLVTERRSSLEALETFRAAPDQFDLVITDQTMPTMTGAELAQRILQIRPNTPIILCTGYSNLINEESAKKLGIKEFTLKPLTKSTISKLIRKVLDDQPILAANSSNSAEF